MRRMDLVPWKYGLHSFDTQAAFAMTDLLYGEGFGFRTRRIDSPELQQPLVVSVVGVRTITALAII